MVRAIFENTSTATSHYPVQGEPETTMHAGRRYMLIGESEGEVLSCGERFARVLGVIGLIVTAIFTLCIPLFFQCFRSKIATLITEITQGRERCTHWMPAQHYLCVSETYARNCVDALTRHLIQTTHVDSVRSATCCISIPSLALSWQFIFQKPDETSFTREELYAQLSRMEPALNNLIRPHFNRPLQTLQANYLLILKSDSSPPSDLLYVTRRLHDSAILTLSDSSSTGSADKQSIDQLLQQVHFAPAETLAEDLSFIRGPHYQEIPLD